jgi:Tfp pilus assembly protein PilN
MSESLNLRDEIARIDRAMAETQKFSAETQKSVAEQQKLIAEARKLHRDRALVPWQVIATLLGAGAALFAAGAGFVKLIGG